jgi:dynein heavy chain, axonemal
MIIFFFDKIKKRLRTYPSLVSCTTIDWYLPWTEEAYMTTAKILL